MAKKKADKKVLLFIVEGENDIAALAYPLESLHKACTADGSIQFDFTDGDITTSKPMKFNEIKNKIAKIIRDYCQQSPRINKSDICEVVLLLDMDGAYIPDEAIVQSDEHKEAFYGESTILHKYTDNVRIPHKRKRHNVDILINIRDVMGGIPFSVYYVACNFEHVACGDANLTALEKSRAADDFAFKFGEDANGFRSFFCDDDTLTLGKTYSDSWDAIREGLNSLHRHSNLNVFINKNYPKT